MTEPRSLMWRILIPRKGSDHLRCKVYFDVEGVSDVGPPA